MAGYSATAWVNGSTPAINADNLNKMEQGLEAGLGYDSLQDLRDEGTPTSVQTAFCRGHTTCGDGGHGPFYWDSTNTDSDDDFVTLLPTSHAGAGRWVRMTQGFVVPQMSGAFPDVATDYESEIQLCIDYAGANHGLVWVDNGTWQVGGELYPRSHCTIQGASRGAVIYQSAKADLFQTLAGVSVSDYSTATQYTLSAVSKGDRDVTLTAGGSFSAGQVVFVQSSDSTSIGGVNHPDHCQINRVVTQVSTVVTLEDPVSADITNPTLSIGTYSAGDATQKELLQNFHLRRLTLQGDTGYLYADNPVAMRLRSAYKCTFSELNIQGFHSAFYGNSFGYCDISHNTASVAKRSTELKLGSIGTVVAHNTFVVTDEFITSAAYPQIEFGERISGMRFIDNEIIYEGGRTSTSGTIISTQTSGAANCIVDGLKISNASANYLAVIQDTDGFQTGGFVVRNVDLINCEIQTGIQIQGGSEWVSSTINGITVENLNADADTDTLTDALTNPVAVSIGASDVGNFADILLKTIRIKGDWRATNGTGYSVSGLDVHHCEIEDFFAATWNFDWWAENASFSGCHHQTPSFTYTGDYDVLSTTSTSYVDFAEIEFPTGEAYYGAEIEIRTMGYVDASATYGADLEVVIYADQGSGLGDITVLASANTPDSTIAHYDLTTTLICRDYDGLNFDVVTSGHGLEGQSVIDISRVVASNGYDPVNDGFKIRVRGKVDNAAITLRNTTHIRIKRFGETDFHL